MSTTARYKEIKETYPEKHKCFFAFNDKQFEEGKARSGILPDEKIYRYGAGMFGTKEGLERYNRDLDAILARIPVECDPQDVYDHEFANHECGYVGDDTQAIKLVTAYFGEQVAKTVERRCGWADIDSLFKTDNDK
jgi:hypothetical protein